MHVSHPAAAGARTVVFACMNPAGIDDKGESEYEIQAERFTYGATQSQAGGGG